MKLMHTVQPQEDSFVLNRRVGSIFVWGCTLDAVDSDAVDFVYSILCNINICMRAAVDIASVGHRGVREFYLILIMYTCAIR